MYEIQVNGETVWTSDDDENLVTEISIQTPRGEATMLRVPPEEKVLNLVTVPRSLENLPMDLVEEAARREKRERFEVGHTDEELSDEDVPPFDVEDPNQITN